VCVCVCVCVCVRFQLERRDRNRVVPFFLSGQVNKGDRRSFSVGFSPSPNYEMLIDRVRQFTVPKPNVSHKKIRFHT